MSKLVGGFVDAGFTLVELLVAVTILSIVVLGGATATLGAIRANRESEAHVIATARAQDALECLKTQYATKQALTGTCNPNALPAGFTIVAPLADTASYPGFTRLRVTVSWTGFNGGSVILETLINGT